jgi:hypothetical protein
VPVFQSTWDLQGAMRLTYDDSTLIALPFSPGVVCTKGGLAVPGGAGASTIPQASGMAYGHLVFVDVPRARPIPIRDFSTCSRELKQLSAVR